VQRKEIFDGDSHTGIIGFEKDDFVFEHLPYNVQFLAVDLATEAERVKESLSF
jgi:hypothetical protein